MTGRRSAALAAAASLIAAAALSACSSSSGAQPGGQSFVAGDQSVTVLAPDQRPALGALRGQTIDGQAVDLTAQKGSTLVVNVWGSWCAPCQKEAPALEKAARQLQGKGVKFYGINVREGGNKDAAAAFQRTYGISYPSIFDADSTALLALRGAVSPNAIPSTVVVDAQGRVAARISGATTTSTLVGLVDDVLAGRTRSA